MVKKEYSLDVIIPVYNNADVLPQTLSAIPDDVHVIVVDDGSSDTSVDIIKKEKPQATLIMQQHRGSATARNNAIKASQADVIICIGADIQLHPEAIEHHRSFHQMNTQPMQAGLGMVMWDPRLVPTALMEYMIHGGSQNNFDDILGATQVDPAHYFYGSHISFRRKDIASVLFNEHYQQYGWEDLDTGRRWQQAGGKLYVLHKAISHHMHFYTSHDIKKRQYQIGQSIVQYQDQFPTVPIAPNIKPKQYIKAWLYRWGGIRIVGWFLVHVWPWSVPVLYKFMTNAEFWYGYTQKVRSYPHSYPQ